MNIQHSSRTDRWFTPVYLIESARKVLGTIDLDPASEPLANERVKASKYYTETDDGLLQPWFGSVFVNPPGGRRGRDSISALFWGKLMAEKYNVDHAIWLGFSLEQLQTTQKYGVGIVEFPFCVPRKRVRFDKPDGSPGDAPSHSNVIVYTPGKVNRTSEFHRVFSQYGSVCIPWNGPAIMIGRL